MAQEEIVVRAGFRRNKPVYYKGNLGRQVQIDQIKEFGPDNLGRRSKLTK